MFSYAMYDANPAVSRDTAMLCFYIKTFMGDSTWNDKNRDGFRSPNEMGIGGVKVVLHACNGSVPGNPIPGFETVSDENGFYILPMPGPGSYALSFNASMLDSGHYHLTIPNIEGNSIDLHDSDANFNTGFTGCFTVVAGNPSITDLDAGVFLDEDGDFQPDCLEQDSSVVDPMGYIYCEHTGEILNNGLITASGPGNVYMVFNGSNGYYQFLVDAVGLYTITLTNPPGFASSVDCVPETGPFIAPPDSLVFIGSSDADADDFLDDKQCASNPFYFTLYLNPGSLVSDNNFPMSCLDLGDLPADYPTLLADDGPRHAILQNPKVFLGTTVDIEPNGQPEAMAGMMAGGDDAPTSTGPDDEDGIATLPSFVASTNVPVIVQVNNQSDKNAKLVGFIDFNHDFDFDDPGEMLSSPVAAG
jgi:hypothetical protein